jgi:hypothetical protein
MAHLGLWLDREVVARQESGLAARGAARKRVSGRIDGVIGGQVELCDAHRHRRQVEREDAADSPTASTKQS